MDLLQTTIGRDLTGTVIDFLIPSLNDYKVKHKQFLNLIHRSIRIVRCCPVCHKIFFRPDVIIQSPRRKRNIHEIDLRERTLYDRYDNNPIIFDPVPLLKIENLCPYHNYDTYREKISKECALLIGINHTRPIITLAELKNYIMTLLYNEGAYNPISKKINFNHHLVISLSKNILREIPLISNELQFWTNFRTHEGKFARSAATPILYSKMPSLISCTVY